MSLQVVKRETTRIMTSYLGNRGSLIARPLLRECKKRNDCAASGPSVDDSAVALSVADSVTLVRSVGVETNCEQAPRGVALEKDDPSPMRSKRSACSAGSEKPRKPGGPTFARETLRRGPHLGAKYTARMYAPPPPSADRICKSRAARPWPRAAQKRRCCFIAHAHEPPGPPSLGS